MLSDGTEKALTENRDHGKAKEARAARFAGLERFRSDKVTVIWKPNQIFEKSEERATTRKRSRPFAFGGGQGSELEPAPTQANLRLEWGTS